MWFDFLHTIFIIFLIVFIGLYIVVGGRLGIIYQIGRAIMPFAYFFLIFLVRTKLTQYEYKKHKKEANFEERLTYISSRDIKLDIIVIIILSLSVLGWTLVNQLFLWLDLLQATIVFGFLYIWHIKLFSKVDIKNNFHYIDYLDKIKDEVITMLVPVIIVIPPLINMQIDIVDVWQAFTVLLGLQAWRLYLFRDAKY